MHRTPSRPAPLRRIAGAVALTIALLASAGVAAGAPAPGLGVADCLADTAIGGCTDLPGTPLDGPTGVALSPDGRTVYVAARDGAAVSWFRRSTTGGLTFAGCLADEAAARCRALAGSPLTGASGVAVSRDGRSVYVVSATADAIAQFVRSRRTGALSFAGCLADDPATGCADLPGDPLDGATGVAVSRDGRSVYVASALGDTIAQFVRGGPAGRLSYDGCLGGQPAALCTPVPGSPLRGARAVALSPDDGSVYVAAAGSGALARLTRDGATGRLAYAGCLGGDGAAGCTALRRAPLAGAAGVAVSPDGLSVYVAAAGAGALARFARAADGALRFRGCVADDARRGCAALAGRNLTGATGVAVAPDGGSVYVAARSRGAVSRFARDRRTGDVTAAGCVAVRPDAACPGFLGSSLAGATGLAVNPDGGSLQVTGAAADALVVVFRSS